MKRALTQTLAGDSKRAQAWLAWKDFIGGLRRHRVWQVLALADIKFRYRRSVLGPLWTTITMAITIGSMGVIYASLFHLKIEGYLPYLAAGMISWSFISSLINELSDAFVSNEGLIQQIKLPFFLHIHRVIWRNFIVLAHNMVVWLIVIGVFHASIKSYGNLWFLMPNLLLMYVNAITIGVILAMVSARFRDLSHIVKNLLQILFFITPIMWQPQHLSPRLHLVCTANPLYLFVELLRAPMLGRIPADYIYESVLTITLIACLAASIIFIKFRKRIIYWL